MKNILLITQSLTGGGAEKVVANLSIGLSKYANVFIATYENTKEKYDYMGQLIDISVPGGNCGFFQRLWNAFRRVTLIRDIKRKYNIDYAISFVPQTDYANVLSRIKECSQIIEVSSNTSSANEGCFSHFLRKCVINQADTIVSVSEGSRRDLVKNFSISEDKIKCIYNLIDLDRIDQRSKENYNKLEYPSKYIMAIGSFRKPKGHWHLIKAFAAIADKIPDYSLVILGDGEYREKYNELIKNLKLSNERVIMPGFVSNPYPIIRDSELLVFSSIYEGFGNVIIEAMCCGTPVLSTDCDYGPREILAPGTDYSKKATDFEETPYGYLLPPFDLEDINTDTVISKQEELMGKSIIEIIYNKDNRSIISNSINRSRHFGIMEVTEKWRETLHI